ncbi:MAG: response regulator transcription factor [Candidatus Tyrphobacter sp.]
MGCAQIVVAEDDEPIRALLIHHLEGERYGVVGVADGSAALRAARSVGDALVLDLGLPGLGGLEVLRALRGEGRRLPVLVLTARTDEVDRVVGFEAGADDYVCKPFSPREVVARIRVLLRRKDESVQTADVRRHGRLEIDERAREVRVDGRPVAMKPQEYALLSVLATNAGVALSREHLLAKAWGYDFSGDERTVDAHVRRLRRQLEQPFGLCLIETLRGFGYKFRRV